MTRTLATLEGTAYYVTADHLINSDRAKRLAAARNLKLETLFPKKLPPPIDAVALFVDLDNQGFDAHGRRAWLAAATATPPKVVTCAHSFDFDEESDAKNLIMARRFDDQLLRRLLVSLRVQPEESNFIPDTPEPGGLDPDELARIGIGSDGGPLCD